MTAPLLPHQSSYRELHDNKNEAKNDNECLFGAGDTNANQILPTGQMPKGEAKRCHGADQQGVLSFTVSETAAWSGKEQRKCLAWVPESQAGGLSVKDHKRYSPVTRKCHEEFTADDHRDGLRPISQGHVERTQIAPERSTSSDITRYDRGAPLTLFDTERFAHFPYGGSSHPSVRSETCSTGDTGISTCKALYSPSPASPDTLSDSTGAILKSPKTTADHFIGLAVHPLDNTSEENKTVFYPKTSTSEIKKSHSPKLRTDAGNLSNSNNESTFHPTYAEQHLNLISKSQEICNLSEAQLGQTDKGRRLGLQPPKSSWQSRAESIMLVEMVTCQRDGSIGMRAKYACGMDTAEPRHPQMQDIFSETEDLCLRQPDAGSEGRPTCGSTVSLLASGSLDNANWALDQSSQDYANTQKDHRPAFTVPDEPTNLQPSSTPLLSRNRFFDENEACCFAAGKDPNLYVHNVNPPGNEALRDTENKMIHGKAKTDTASVKASDFSDFQRFWSKETAPPECPTYQDRYTDNLALAGSNKTISEEAALAVQNKKAATRQRHPSDDSKESYKTLTSGDATLSLPVPACPGARVNMNKQTSTLRNLYALHVDRLSPSTVLPPLESTQLLNIPPQVTSTSPCNSGIPKAVLIHSKPSLTTTIDLESSHRDMADEKMEVPLAVPKPRHVRPKIITYIRRSPQPADRLASPFEPTGSLIGTPTCTASTLTDPRAFSADAKSPSVLYDKCKPDEQKPRVYGSGLMVSGIKPPGHQFSQITEKYLQEVAERPGKDECCSTPCPHYEVPPGFYRSAMILKPQLGLGAVSRLPSAKSRILIASQRPPPALSGALHQPGQVASTESLYQAEASVDLKKASIHNAVKASHPKPCSSGLRPPGYSRLPTAKLPSYSFVRTSSVSSVSSNQSNDSVQSDSTKTVNRSSLANEEQSTPKAAVPSKDIPKGSSRMVQQVPNGVSTIRRSFLPAPKANAAPAEKVNFPSSGSPRRSSPSSGSKKMQKEQDFKPAVVSPKRLVMSATSLYSPGHSKPRPGIPRNGFHARPEPDRQLVQRLKEKCEAQSRQLLCVQEELKRASRGFEVFAVATQHFFKKNERGLMKEKELSIELTNIREEVAVNTAKCEKLQKEKEELEIRFEDEVRKLQCQQQAELRALEERLQLQYRNEMERLQSDHTTEFARIKSMHKEQIEDMVTTHAATVQDLETHHTEAIAVLQDEHNYQVEELKSTHELEKKTLEDNFENLRLSLQDQVDTLTFQSHSLRDRAKRFEEALRKSTDEQFQVALAPFQHLEEDLTSLKQVLEMKNQQIHQQEKKIMELEKLVDINVRLEERIQVLQQQNEDLKVRIDQNVAVTRHLSEENANLHESVEKESEEKKRLSRTNEELIWKLQTGEPMSPVRLSPSSTLYPSVSGALSPSKVQAAPR
ncbi:microtubule-associated tumor suppressor candidate 2 [Ambystoma mexicanum]|uniref:microtubule-associated tumor suppressor candidate 2 n=1 Tax=Ambystoma mexicanum TaxID=8296 RepID=UPI0037E90C53